MKQHWIDLTTEGAESVVVGLLRDGQYELALDKLEEMTSEGERVPAWVLDVFTYTFAALGFHDEALKIVHHRVLREADHISPYVWYVLLDSCGRAHHHAGVQYVWARMVQPRLLNPSDAVCLDVLNTAARAGDAALASQALDHMAARGARLGLHHFEPLVDAYAAAGDVPNALQALCIMHAAGIPAAAGSTRALFRALRHDPVAAAPALETLRELRARYTVVPVAAVNVVLEALLATGAVAAALDAYRDVRQLCGTGPDAATFAVLLRRVEAPRDVVFLGHEMIAFGIAPSAEMLDTLVCAHAAGGSLELGLKFLSDLVAMGAAAGSGCEPWIREKTAAALVRRCFLEEDQRLWQIADVSKAKGLSLEKMIKDVAETMTKEKADRLPSAEAAPAEPVTLSG